MFLTDQPQGNPSRRENESAPITKLSQAIRIGAMLRPQCEGRMFREGRSCAIGAAYEAIFGYPGDLPEGSFDAGIVQRHYQDRLSEVVELPDRPVKCIGILRNDNGWTREAIADWLESQGL